MLIIKFLLQNILIVSYPYSPLPEMPENWKIAYSMQIDKEGGWNDLKNCRLIRLISLIVLQKTF